jgi:DNA polymerase I-like protein with 3'-5' exonuclease and polymerase domains
MARKSQNCVGQLPIFRPECSWRPPSLSNLPKWDDAKRVGVDIETKDPDLTKLGPGVRRKGNYIVGVSFAIEDGPKHYLPIRHEGGDNLNPAKVIEYLQDQAKNFTGSICGANIGYDLDWLAEEKVIFCRATFKDIQVAEPLIDENQFSYSLETISKKYGFEGKTETALREAAKAYGLDPKKDLWRLPGRYVGVYAEDDADLPLKILRKQERIIKDQELWDIYDLECQVTPVLVKMRRRGIRIDFDQLDRVEEFTMEKECEFLQIIYDKTGVRINMDEINKTKLVVKACDVAQIPYGRTAPSKTYPDGQPSVKREFLEPNADHPVVNAILEARSYNKVRNTFVESIRKHATNGRIHCTFNQLRRQDDNSDDVKGAGPGRLSSCNPNLQQQPSRHPVLGKMWRSIYLPDKGGKWAACDYAQQEPRLFVHFAHIAGCPGTQSAVDGFAMGYDWHDMTTEMAFGIKKEDDPKFFKQMRKKAKAVFLGLTYGMGQAKMCHSCGFATEKISIRGALREVAGPEGRAFLEEFNRKVPFLKDIKDRVERVAWNRRFIRTILGRHIHYPPNRNMERKALNNLIQGSAADQTKLAMVLLDKENYKIQLQIHDEIDITVYDEKTAMDMAEIMKTCVPLVMPSKVDVEIGANWGDSME